MISINDLLFAIEPILRTLPALLAVSLFLGYRIAKLERENNILLWRVELMQYKIEILEAKVNYLDTRMACLSEHVSTTNKHDVGENWETTIKRLKQEEKSNG
jgi:hypothetical protein